VRRGQQQRDEGGVAVGEDVDGCGPAGVEHGDGVLDPLLDRRWRGRRDWVGQAQAPPVEGDHPPSRCESRDGLGQVRLLQVGVDGDEGRVEQQDVGGPVAVRAVRHVHTTGVGVAGEVDRDGGPRRCRLRGHSRGVRNGEVEDGRFESSQCGPRLDPDILHQEPAHGPVRVERIGLATAAVQRLHAQAPQPLPQRVRRCQGLELAHGVGRRAGGDHGSQVVLDQEQVLLR